MKKKSNKNITFTKDDDKSYIYITEGNRNIGIFLWNFYKKKWVFDDAQIK